MKRTSCIFIFVLFFLALFFTNCTDKSKRIIPEKKFVNLLTDIHLADGIGVDNIGNSTAPYVLDSASLYGSVLGKYRVSWQEFDNTMAFYSSHPDDCSRMYKKVISRLKRLEEEQNQLEIQQDQGLQGKEEEEEKEQRQ